MAVNTFFGRRIRFHQEPHSALHTVDKRAYGKLDTAPTCD